ncbi:MAG: MEDS domain-containing protein [Thermoproteota archaeon]|nr:MEDS domain-containing protein [Thermoproteota archaeon]
MPSSGKPTSVLKDHFRVLLVDDETDIVHVLKQGLEVNGFEVDAYDSPQQAINSFKPNLYDLAILDIRMPGLNGFALQRQMKKIDPALTTCFLSAFEIHPQEFEKMFPSMADSVKTIIKKPVRISNLIKEITPFLKMSAVARARSGEHFLIVFETPQELIDQSLQFLKIGLLEKDEDILMVTDALPKDRIREKIAKEWNVDVRSLEASGRITIMTFREWHLIDDKFDIKRSKIMMAEMVQKALDSGRKGFRSVGDMNPFFSTGRIQQLLAWESSLEKQFELPIISLCGYTRDKVEQLDKSAIAVMQQCHGRTTGVTSKRR